MNLKDRLSLYERQAAILEGIAKQYAETTAEHSAIRQAAIALWYALSRPQSDFLDYLEKWNRGELTPQQEAHLRSMGIDPDAVDDL
jgi:hypothetical protein